MSAKQKHCQIKKTTFWLPCRDPWSIHHQNARRSTWDRPPTVKNFRQIRSAVLEEMPCNRQADRYPVHGNCKLNMSLLRCGR